MVIFQRLCHRFTHRFQAGKMNDRINLFRIKNPVQPFSVENIGFIKLYGLSCNLLNPVQRFLTGVA